MHESEYVVVEKKTVEVNALADGESVLRLGRSEDDDC